MLAKISRSRCPNWTVIVLALGLQILPSSNAVTVYYQPLQSQLAAASAAALVPAANYSGLPAYNPLVLEAPAPPGPTALPTQFALPLTSAVPAGASIQQNGSFFGFSIEMSVVNQVLGTNASVLQVPFLNLMANLQSRVGRINIRVGGNTQETATLVSSTADGKILEKDHAGVTNPTQTPPLVFTSELLYMLSNISAHVNVRWYLGVPFNDTSNFRLQIVEQGHAILGDYLIGLQVGNEPDLYANHGHRPATYSVTDYFNEFGLMIKALEADPLIPAAVSKLLIGPSIQFIWSPEQVWATGYIQAYTNNLAYLAVERYPSDNCGAIFPTPGNPPRDPQQTFPQFLSHANALNLVALYLPSTALAQQNGKDFLMFETNTASCGGLPGISDSFGAAIWGVDYAMSMAAGNFSGALFHVGGQSVTYNPFLPPPTNQSTYHKWTIGPIYYASLVVAEALGPSNTSQVMDLAANVNNTYTPAYGIWEHGQLSRVLLINFVSDNTTASDLSVSLSLDGNGLPGSVKVKYLSAPSVATKGNITWANQTFGANFQSDGRPVGNEVVETVNCSPAAGATGNTCIIKVPAPSVALVFLAGSGMVTDNAGGPSTTFATTVYTRTRNTVTVDPSVLATSNGRGGSVELGSTSPQYVKKKSEAVTVGDQARRVALGVVGGAVMIGIALVWV